MTEAFGTRRGGLPATVEETGTIRTSSMVERPAVNGMVLGSSPGFGAKASGTANAVPEVATWPSEWGGRFDGLQHRIVKSGIARTFPPHLRNGFHARL